MRVERQHNIFGLARVGYEALFKLRGDDAKYVLSRALELYGDIKQHGGLSMALHVRRGDKHPLEYQYQEDYIPLARYVDTARDIYIDLVENAPSSKSKRSPEEIAKRHTASRMILASDDPLVYDAPEIGPNSIRAQTRIVLATKAALEAASSPDKKNPWIDEITGWEGGFFRDVFFSLGQTSPSAVPAAKNVDVGKEAMGLRELVGRAYLLDLAVLGRADTVVCTVSSTSCRLLGIMLGWDALVGKDEEKRWRSIDGGFEWRGIMW
jgi:hypothetical protein